MEYQAVGDRILKALKDFGKHSKAQKTSSYKKKRLDELQSDWKLFNDLDEKLTIALGNTGDGLESFQKEVEESYAEYHSKLMLLAETDAESEDEGRDDKEQQKQEEEKNDNKRDGDQKVLTEVEKMLNIQEARLGSVKRIMEGIQEKVDNQETLSASYSKIKTQALNSYWERISCTHEDLLSENVPKTYYKTIKALEREYENTLILLHYRGQRQQAEGAETAHR